MNKLAPLFVLAVASMSGVHAATIPASADSSVSSKKPNKKLGAAKTLLVDKATNALIRFDLASLPEGTKPDHVAKATLRLWVRDQPTPGSLAVGLPGTGWSESSVNGASGPGFSATGIVTPLPTEAQSVLDIDVTLLVQGWLGGVANNGLVLTPEIAGNPLKVVFDSRENTQSGREPTLDIDLQNVSTFRMFDVTIPAASWDAGFHYGDGNGHRAFEILPSMVGGVSLPDFHANGGVVLVSIKSTGGSGYSETKAAPYTYSHQVPGGAEIGLRIEYLFTRGEVTLSKTTNGWNSLSPTAAELPTSVKVHVVLIGNATAGV